MLPATLDTNQRVGYDECCFQPLLQVLSLEEVVEMKYELVEEGEISILKLQEARLIYECLDPIQEKFVSMVESGKRKIIMDFTQVDYIDSFAVGFIMDMYRRVNSNNGLLKLTGLQPRVKKILTITRVDNVIDIHADIDEALKAFNN